MSQVIKLTYLEDDTKEFLFPYNPQAVSDEMTPTDMSRPIPYSNLHITIGNATSNAKTINLSGHFSGENKYDQLEDLAYMLKDNSLLKMQFKNDRFAIVKGRPISKNNVSNRTNFLNYSIELEAPISIVFSNTLKEASWNGSWTNGSESNEGKNDTYIEEVEITLGSGNSSGDTIILESANDTGMQLTLQKSYSSGEKITIKLVRYRRTNTIYATDYFLAFDESGDELRVRTPTGKSMQELMLKRGERIDSYSISGSANISNIDFNFRDGFNFI